MYGHNKILYQYMRRIIPALVCLTLIIPAAFAQSIYGNFPYEESFLSGSKPAGVELSDVPKNNLGLANSASFKTYGLQLTPEEFSRFGAVYLNNHRFKSENGIFIEFEYMIYGNRNDGKNGGDGLSVFFFDADVNPGIGAYGAGIGYAYNRVDLRNAEHRKVRNPGINGGYMGIAFDSYGNYKGLRYQGESRVNGIPYGFTDLTGSVSSTYNTSSDVTIRGPKNPDPIKAPSGNTVPGFDAGYVGYPVMVTQNTTAQIGFEMLENGNYSWQLKNHLRTTDFFNVRGGTTFIKPEDPGYRKAYIELFPSKDAQGVANGYLVTVMIEHDMVRDTVIYDYKFRNTFTYLENAWRNDGLGDNTDREYPQPASLERTISLVPPPELKIGFAASTGQDGTDGPKRDFHVIKNLRVKLPRAAHANDDFAEIYKGRTAVIDPLVNDVAYTGTISRVQQGSKDNIEPESFQFHMLDGQPILGSSYTDANGRWEYSKVNEGIEVRFTPNASLPLGQPAKIKYSIKGGKLKNGTPEMPYADDAYRSPAATISVTVTENPNPEVNTVTNKMITTKFK